MKIEDSITPESVKEATGFDTVEDFHAFLATQDHAMLMRVGGEQFLGQYEPDVTEMVAHAQTIMAAFPGDRGTGAGTLYGEVMRDITSVEVSPEGLLNLAATLVASVWLLAEAETKLAQLSDGNSRVGENKDAPNSEHPE